MSAKADQLMLLLRKAGISSVAFVNPSSPTYGFVSKVSTEAGRAAELFDRVAAKTQDYTLHFHAGEDGVVGVGPLEALKIAAGVHEVLSPKFTQPEREFTIKSACLATVGTIRVMVKGESAPRDVGLNAAETLFCAAE